MDVSATGSHLRFRGKFCAICSSRRFNLESQSFLCGICRDAFKSLNLGGVSLKNEIRISGNCYFCGKQGTNVTLSICLSCVSEFQARLKLDMASLRTLQSSREKRQAESLSFLRHLDPSPLSGDFKGDVYFMFEHSSEVVQAHDFILSSKSSVFRKMLEVDMKEKRTRKIYIKDASPTVFRAGINFLYTAKIDFGTELVTPLAVLRFAHKYDIKLLKGLCEAELTKTVRSHNLLEMFSIAHRFGADVLKQKAMKFFNEHPEVHQRVIEGFLNEFLTSECECLDSVEDVHDVD